MTETVAAPPHAIHLGDQVGTVNLRCPDCRAALREFARSLQVIPEPKIPLLDRASVLGAIEGISGPMLIAERAIEHNGTGERPVLLLTIEGVEEQMSIELGSHAVAQLRACIEDWERS